MLYQFLILLKHLCGIKLLEKCKKVKLNQLMIYVELYIGSAAAARKRNQEFKADTKTTDYSILQSAEHSGKASVIPLSISTTVQGPTKPLLSNKSSNTLTETDYVK